GPGIPQSHSRPETESGSCLQTGKGHRQGRIGADEECAHGGATSKASGAEGRAQGSRTGPMGLSNRKLQEPESDRPTKDRDCGNREGVPPQSARRRQQAARRCQGRDCRDPGCYEVMTGGGQKALAWTIAEARADKCLCSKEVPMREVEYLCSEVPRFP